jgi:hypothetical protein
MEITLVNRTELYVFCKSFYIQLLKKKIYDTKSLGESELFGFILIECE